MDFLFLFLWFCINIKYKCLFLSFFLRAWGKQKILIPFGNQDFTVFCFSSKWCHQESNLLLRFILTP